MSALLVMLLATQAPAPDPYLSRAQNLVDDAEYRRAQRVISRGLLRPGLSGALLAAFFSLDGECNLARGRTRAARASFVKVLTVQPGFRFSADRSPKLRALLEEVRADLIARGEIARPYSPEHRPLGAVERGGRAVVEVAFTGPAPVDRVVLYSRSLGTSVFSAVDAAPQVNEDGDAGWRAVVPAGLTVSSGPGIEYWLAGFDRGERVVVVGDEREPFRFLVLSEEELALGEEEIDAPFPVVPVAVGAAAAALVAAIVVGVSAIALQPNTARATVVVSAP